MEQVCKSEGGQGKKRAAWVLPGFLPSSTFFQAHLLALGHGDGGAGSKSSLQRGDENARKRHLGVSLRHCRTDLQRDFSVTQHGWSRQPSPACCGQGRGRGGPLTASGSASTTLQPHARRTAPARTDPRSERARTSAKNCSKAWELSCTRPNAARRLKQAKLPRCLLNVAGLSAKRTFSRNKKVFLKLSYFFCCFQNLYLYKLSVSSWHMCSPGVEDTVMLYARSWWRSEGLASGGQEGRRTQPPPHKKALNLAPE